MKLVFRRIRLIYTYILRLRVAEVTRSLDMAIFVLMTMTTMTRPITLPPSACARGNEPQTGPEL